MVLLASIYVAFLPFSSIAAFFSGTSDFLLPLGLLTNDEVPPPRPEPFIGTALIIELNT